MTTQDQIELIKAKLLAQAFVIQQLAIAVSGRSPQLMCWWLQSRVDHLKNATPPDNGPVPPAVLDEAIIAAMPEIERLTQAIIVGLSEHGENIRNGEAGIATLLFR